jgi:hypothetical protein
MLSIYFSSVLGDRKRFYVATLDGLQEILINTVSPVCSILTLVDGKKVLKCGEHFTMVCSTHNGPAEVTPLANRFFSMGHSTVHMLRYKGITVMRITAPIAKQGHIDTGSVIVKTEEEERDHMIAFIRQFENCEKLRARIEEIGTYNYYYKWTSVPVDWITYTEFVEDTECWCGECDT